LFPDARVDISMSAPVNKNSHYSLPTGSRSQAGKLGATSVGAQSSGFFRPSVLLPPPPPKDVGSYHKYLVAYELYLSKLAEHKAAFWGRSEKSDPVKPSGVPPANPAQDNPSHESLAAWGLTALPEMAEQSEQPPVQHGSVSRISRVERVCTDSIPEWLSEYLADSASRSGLESVNLNTFKLFVDSLAHKKLSLSDDVLDKMLQIVDNDDGTEMVLFSSYFYSFTRVSVNDIPSDSFPIVMWLDWIKAERKRDVTPPRSPARSRVPLPSSAVPVDQGIPSSSVKVTNDPVEQDPVSKVRSEAFMARRRAAKRRQRAGRAQRNLAARTEKAKAVAGYLSAKKEVLVAANSVKNAVKKAKTATTKLSGPSEKKVATPGASEKKTPMSEKAKGKQPAEKSAAAPSNSRARRSARRAALRRTSLD